MPMLYIGSFFNTVEFYVILAVIAAAIVALSARPGSKGPVIEYLLAGELYPADDEEPMVQINCLDTGAIAITRFGIAGINENGAISLAITKKGQDLFIEERLTPGSGFGLPTQVGLFTLKTLPPGRYHVKYNSDKTGLFAAFPLHITPGLRSLHPLKM